MNKWFEAQNTDRLVINVFGGKSSVGSYVYGELVSDLSKSSTSVSNHDVIFIDKHSPIHFTENESMILRFSDGLVSTCNEDTLLTLMNDVFHYTQGNRIYFVNPSALMIYRNREKQIRYSDIQSCSIIELEEV